MEGKGEKVRPAYELEISQVQRLALTPELRQAIMVLQMNAVELVQFVRSEVEENPLLEMVEEWPEEPLPESEPSEEELLVYFCDSTDPGMPPVRRSRISSGPQTLIEQPVSLRDHLLSQLVLSPLRDQEWAIGEFIVGSIDSNGYLTCPTSEIAQVMVKPISTVEKVLAVVQGLEPPGIGARTLKECLTIQAKVRGLDELAQHIVDDHLEDLAGGRYKKIAGQEKVSLEQVLQARDRIISLDPKPGATFSGRGATHVIPDVFIKKIGHEMVLLFNDSAVPSIGWNSFYRRLLEAGEGDARDYLIDRLKRARALLNSVEQRRNTIMQVMTCIMRRQEKFLQKGPGYLEPLTLKEIAEDLGIHESTVSRSIAGKYVDTPFGTFPCRVFFSPRLAGEGKDVSQHSVKRYIQRLIDDEDGRAPLSDQQISERLSERGVQVARRTVAKYRAQLGILPSNRRRTP